MEGRAVALSACVVLACIAVAASYCEICNVRNSHTLDYATPVEDTVDWQNCAGWKDNACCSTEQVELIHTPDVTAYDGYEYDRCDRAEDRTTQPQMSDACRRWFQLEECLYECDVNVGKFRAAEVCDISEDAERSDDGWRIRDMPLKAAECTQWQEDCKDDFICACNEASGDCPDPGNFKNIFALPLVDCTFTGEFPTCQKFSDVYETGAHVCEDMWDFAFRSVSEADGEGDHGVPAYTLDVPTSGPNPNNEVLLEVPHLPRCDGHETTQSVQEACEDLERHPVVEPHSCHLCQVINLASDEGSDPKDTRLVSGPVSGDLGVCAAYEGNACCTPERTADIGDDDAIHSFGNSYRWDTCYVSDNPALPSPADFPRACQKWFQAENCLYECDVNVGKYRLHENCEVGGGNTWQIRKMPLRASECDQWFQDCKDVRFCGTAGEPRHLFDEGFDVDACTVGATAADTQCANTVGEIFGDGKTWCEVLWKDSFHYEEVERHAYSLAWMLDAAPGTANPNNQVRTALGFDLPCPQREEVSEEEACAAAQEAVEAPAGDGASTMRWSLVAWTLVVAAVIAVLAA